MACGTWQQIVLLELDVNAGRERTVILGDWRVNSGEGTKSLSAIFHSYFVKVPVRLVSLKFELHRLSPSL